MDDGPPTIIESRISPPPVDCPNCDHLMPTALGEIGCVVCGAVVRIEHEPTRKAWIDEKAPCPACAAILVVGLDDRPAELRCAACKHEFSLVHKAIKAEIECPSCERHLRIKQRPGSRELTCPACSERFKVTF